MLISWGVLTFGGVYQWSYVPLLVGSALVGMYGIAVANPIERRAAYPLGYVLAAAAAFTAVQLIPVPWYTLAGISPATDAFLREYNLVYAIGTQTGEAVRHPLSISPLHTWRGLFFIIGLGIFTVGCTALLPAISTRRLIQSLIPIGVAIAVFGIAQKATFNGRIYWVWTSYTDTANVFGPFVNRNHFAGWMLMMAILTAGYLAGQFSAHATQQTSTWQRRVSWLSTEHAASIVLSGFAVMVMSIAVLWSLSRSGILALSVGLMLLAGRVATRIPRGRGVLLALALFGIIASAVAWRGSERLADWYSRTGSLERRLEIWRQTLPMLSDFRWFGTGLNTYGVATRLYLPPDPVWHTSAAHSDYVQILAEGGLTLALITTIGICVVCVCVRRRLNDAQTTSNYWIRTSAAIALLAIALQEVTDFSLQLPGNAVMFCLLLSIALHRPRAPRRHRGGDALPAVPFAPPGATDRSGSRSRYLKRIGKSRRAFQ